MRPPLPSVDGNVNTPFPWNGEGPLPFHAYAGMTVGPWENDGLVGRAAWKFGSGEELHGRVEFLCDGVECTYEGRLLP